MGEELSCSPLDNLVEFKIALEALNVGAGGGAVTHPIEVTSNASEPALPSSGTLGVWIDPTGNLAGTGPRYHIAYGGVATQWLWIGEE